MTDEPFIALYASAADGVLCFDRTNGFKLWRVGAWVRHRGGMRAHWRDVAAGRTVIVHSLEFRPYAAFGIERDSQGALIGRVPLAMAFGIAASGPVDERYLRRCFSPHEAERIMDGLHLLICEMQREPPPPYITPGDSIYHETRRAIVGRTPDALVIR